MSNPNKDRMGSYEKERSGKAKPSKDDKDDDDKENPEEIDDEEEEDDGFQFKWLDNGRRRDGRREYETVLLTLHGTSFRVTRNDFVLLWGDHVDDRTDDDMMNQTIEEIWQAAGCAKVEAMWEDRSSNSGQPRAMFQARWFFQVCVLSNHLFIYLYTCTSLPVDRCTKYRGYVIV